MHVCTGICCAAFLIYVICAFGIKFNQFGSIIDWRNRVHVINLMLLLLQHSTYILSSYMTGNHKAMPTGLLYQLLNVDLNNTSFNNS